MSIYIQGRENLNFFVIVFYINILEKPSIVILTPAGKMFTEGGNLQISVQVTGEPQPNITWQRGGVDIDEREDPRVTITGANLTLSNVQPNDAGEYKITAVNIADTVEKCYNVIVHCKTTFILLSVSVFV